MVMKENVKKSYISNDNNKKIKRRGHLFCHVYSFLTDVICHFALLGITVCFITKKLLHIF